MRIIDFIKVYKPNSESVALFDGDNMTEYRTIGDLPIRLANEYINEITYDRGTDTLIMQIYSDCASYDD